MALTGSSCAADDRRHPLHSRTRDFEGRFRLIAATHPLWLDDCYGLGQTSNSTRRPSASGNSLRRPVHCAQQHLSVGIQRYQRFVLRAFPVRGEQLCRSSHAPRLNRCTILFGERSITFGNDSVARELGGESATGRALERGRPHAEPAPHFVRSVHLCDGPSKPVKYSSAESGVLEQNGQNLSDSTSRMDA